MSDILEKIEAEIEKDKDLQRRKEEFQEKDLFLKEHRVDRDLKELVQNNTELEKAKKINFGPMSRETIQAMVASNDEYMRSAKNSMLFINEEFDKLVPYFRKNLILIAGDTGDGKSTTVANIIYDTINRINPATSKKGRVLVLSNEEAPEDFYNRITCLYTGLAYINHNKFTDEQRETFNSYIPVWAEEGRLTIIGDTYEGVSGWTTTIEGIETIFNNLLRDGHTYDTVIIDYYQNVKRSKINPKLLDWEVQAKLSSFLDLMKLQYPGAIVVMAQMKKRVDEDDSTPFNVRLKGSKTICDKATFICELIPERKLYRSKWFVWKSRFNEAVGEFIYTGFDRGKFVPYSAAFQESIRDRVIKNLEEENEKKVGIHKDKKKENE